MSKGRVMFDAAGKRPGPTHDGEHGRRSVCFLRDPDVNGLKSGAIL